MEIAGKIVCIVITNSFLFKASKLCYEPGWVSSFLLSLLKSLSINLRIIPSFSVKFYWISSLALVAFEWLSPLPVYNLYSFNVSDEAVN